LEKISSSILLSKELEEICRRVFTGVLDFEKRDDSNSPISNIRQKLEWGAEKLLLLGTGICPYKKRYKWHRFLTVSNGDVFTVL
jgi:hypothetical protein